MQLIKFVSQEKKHGELIGVPSSGANGFYFRRRLVFEEVVISFGC